MDYKITSDGALGTHLVGYIEATRSYLELFFNQPNEYGEGDKITTQWEIEFVNGVEASVYDWKRYDEGAPELNEVIEWHIGGSSAESLELVAEVLGLPARASA
jgi:hypothetical protein